MKSGWRALALETGWLFDCAIASFGLTGAWLGYRVVLPGGTLDIQMHNTYFVLAWWLVLLPLFLAAAVPLTIARAAQAGYRQRTTNAVLAGLALLVLPGLAVPSFWLWQGLHGR